MRAVETIACKAAEEVVRLAPVADLCPACRSDNIIKHGVRHNKNYDVQRCSCKAYGKRLSANLGFAGMQASPETITNAVQLHCTDLSLRDIQEFFPRIRGRSSAMSRWVTGSPSTSP